MEARQLIHAIRIIAICKDVLYCEHLPQRDTTALLLNQNQIRNPASSRRTPSYLPNESLFLSGVVAVSVGVLPFEFDLLDERRKPEMVFPSIEEHDVVSSFVSK